MNPSKREEETIDPETKDKEFVKIIRILKNLPLNKIETLKKLIERQMNFQSKRVRMAQVQKRKIAEEYFSGQVDLWDSIFQALEESK